MKKLQKYKNEIHKCSKCGLCQSVCPVYQITGNDCSVSRGKFIMLNGVLKGDLKLNKNINKYLDMCLKCNACKNFCPSGIDAREIFTAAKAQYFEDSSCLLSKSFIKSFQSKIVFNFFMNCSKFAANAYRTLKIYKLVKKFYPLLLKFGWLGRKIILANEFISNNNFNKSNSVIARSEQSERRGNPKKTLLDCFAAFHFARNDKNNIQTSTNNAKSKIVYFKGCVNEYLNPRTKIATENVLNKMGANILPAKFECCGVPFLSSGNLKQFIKQAEYNLSQIPDEFDYFLTDCASCQNAFKEYESYIEDEKLLEKLKKINEKSINVVDFIVKNAKSFEFSENVSFTFHKPCHLEDLSFLKEFLDKAQNVEYREMQDFDKCCGFSGEFAIKNPKLSEQISTQKAQNAINADTDYILTSCPACILGLEQGLICEQGTVNSKQKNITSPLNFVEFLQLADIKLKSDFENEDCEKKLLDAFVKKCF